MTLLETVIALVILALSAVGLLEVFETSSRSAGSAQEWVTAVSYAEEEIEAVKIGATASSGIRRQALADGFGRQTSVKLLSPAVADIAVTVSMPRGGSYVVHRLVPVK